MIYFKCSIVYLVHVDCAYSVYLFFLHFVGLEIVLCFLSYLLIIVICWSIFIFCLDSIFFMFVIC